MIVFDALVQAVCTAGKEALSRQREVEFLDREYKTDGSVVTVVDRLVEDMLCTEIAREWSDCNFITEENVREFKAGRRYTVVVDPVDGTDNFSQGLFCWRISVAILDHRMVPIAGIVHCPRLDLLFCADLDGNATLLHHT